MFLLFYSSGLRFRHYFNAKAPLDMPLFSTEKATSLPVILNLNIPQYAAAVERMYSLFLDLGSGTHAHLHKWQEEKATHHEQIEPKRLEEELSKEDLPPLTPTTPVARDSHLATLGATAEKDAEVTAGGLEKEPMVPLTVSGRNSKNDPDLSAQRVSDLKTRILEAQQGNKVERKGEKASAMKSKAAKKKKIQDENPLSPESDLSENDAFGSDEDIATRDKKAGLCCAALRGSVIKISVTVTS